MTLTVLDKFSGINQNKINTMKKFQKNKKALVNKYKKS